MFKSILQKNIMDTVGCTRRSVTFQITQNNVTLYLGS
jgi:hypothetical protein